MVVNAGSSSIKFSLFSEINGEHEKILDGLAERIGVDGRLQFEYHDEKLKFEADFPNHKVAMQFVIDKLIEAKALENIKEIKSVGFRVVHGQNISEPVIIDDKIYAVIKDAIKLAPLHNGASINVIDCMKEILPDAQLVAHFDTGYHQTIPKINHYYPVNRSWYEEYGVRKYGFHGISYEYINMRFKEILKKEPNLIVCHLGNGASICSIRNGKSFDTTMGLTPLAGLMMGTRSGDVDPSIIEYMTRVLKKDVDFVTNEMNKNSGLLGTCGKADMRDVIAGVEANDEQAKFTFDLYCQKIADFIIKMINQFDRSEKVDGIVFTAGIGENSAIVRKTVIEKLNLLDIKLDETKNGSKYDDFELISDGKSQIGIYKMKTNEEKMICNSCLEFLNN